MVYTDPADEKRDWPERLIFAASLGLPLTAGVLFAAPPQLLRSRPDASRVRFSPGCSPGRMRAPIVGGMVGIPAFIAGEWIALPFAVGCGFAGGGLREICPKEAIWQFSPLFFTGLHGHVWRLVRRFEIDWVVILLAAPIGLEIILQALGYHWPNRIFLLHDTATSPAMWFVIRSPRFYPSRFQSRSGTAHASSIACRSRKSCSWPRASTRSRARSIRISCSTR